MPFGAMDGAGWGPASAAFRNVFLEYFCDGKTTTRVCARAALSKCWK